MSRTRLVFAVCLFGLMAAPVFAQEMPMRQDDRVTYDLSAEDWVTTKSAHVTVRVEAAVSSNTTGSMRGDMVKAVNDLAKGDWRLTSFNRSLDQTGLEHWSIEFEARLPESDLNGLADNAKKLSKAGMQLTVTDIDFSPSLAEMEAARASVRTEIYKEANEQLASLNASLPGRNYRIALINFGADDGGVMAPVAMPHVMRGPAAMSAMMKIASDAAPAPAEPPMERSEKVTLSARVVYAAMPPAPGAPPRNAPPAPAPQPVQQQAPAPQGVSQQSPVQPEARPEAKPQ